MLTRIITALLLALPAVAVAACDAVDVEVLPFEVVEDFTQSFKDLSAEAGSATFAAVSAKSYAEVRGCSVKIGYLNPRLRIASELTRHACTFDLQMRHEQGHIEIYRAALATVAARINARRGEDDLAKVVTEELFAVHKLQRAHDSFEEYDRNRTACGGAVYRLTKQ